MRSNAGLQRRMVWSLSNRAMPTGEALRIASSSLVVRRSSAERSATFSSSSLRA
jgi:hypothetical protein